MTFVRVDSKDTEDSGPSVDRPADEEPGDDRAKAPERFAAPATDYIRQHPMAAMAIAFGVGALLQTAVKEAAKRFAQKTGTRTRKVPQPSPPPEPSFSGPRNHGFGVADMEFTTHHPDGKNVVFKFAWKKRPTDAPETDWSTDQMGFTATRANGKHTAFTFTGKTRPLSTGNEKTAAGDHRAGLGRATMEFVSSAPGRRDFRFTWNRVPSTAVAADSDQPSGIAPIRESGSAAVRAVNRQEKLPAKKASKKKAPKKKASKKKASKKTTSKR